MWADTAASYCPSRAGELPKQNMMKSHEQWDGKLCIRSNQDGHLLSSIILSRNSQCHGHSGRTPSLPFGSNALWPSKLGMAEARKWSQKFARHCAAARAWKCRVPPCQNDVAIAMITRNISQCLLNIMMTIITN